MKFLIPTLLLAAALAHCAEDPDTLVIKNDLVQRVLKKDGDVWRTVRFARADGTDAIDVQSDEFHILPMGSEKGWTISDYKVSHGPAMHYMAPNETRFIVYSISYHPKPGVSENAPQNVIVEYGYLNSIFEKRIIIDLAEGQSIDRLQVERFSTVTPASRGGRGEPVFCGAWFFGLEYPAAFNQHSSGSVGHIYDKLGNFSYINLDGREKEFEPRAGLISMAHFPGTPQLEERSPAQINRKIAPKSNFPEMPEIKDLTPKVVPDAYYDRKESLKIKLFHITSKTAVAGIGKKGDTPELAFLDYLNTIRRPVRSFIHYNNWYDGTGKNLKPENFVGKIAHEFMSKMEPYGVKVDAFVPDNGWQNRNSIWRPNPRQFPDGMKSFAELGAALKKEGTSLGLWFTLNGYELNTDWGLKNGYFEAQRNPHFSRFNRYYALGDPHYNADLRAQLSALIKDGQLNYIKHDFNDLCDAGPHNGTLPTDRHGHEKAVDETLSILKMERDLNPDIFQNVTNWAWFSPWWLQHCNTIWMLSDDTGANRKWPAISDWQMATTYRDAHLFKAWGDPATRPLVPISHLMTHGIVNATGAVDGPMSDSIDEWADYVTMYYARGVQLKEWYITPSKMDDAHWKVLGERTQWAQKNSATLANAVYVGGNPEKGEAYGYIAWNGDKGIVTVRNPDMKEQTLKIPFDKSVWYRGENGVVFSAITKFNDYPKALIVKSGSDFSIKIPGWATLVYELRQAQSIKPQEAPPLIEAANCDIKDTHCAFDLALLDRAVGTPSRCALSLIVKGGEIPAVKVDGQIRQIAQHASGPGWKSATFDLLPFWSKKIQIEIVPASAGIFPSAAGEVRVGLLTDGGCHELIQPVKFKSPSATRTLTPDQLLSLTAIKLRLDLFGSDAGQFANKKLLINGEPVLTLPANKHGDNWEEFILDLPAEALKKIALTNKLRVTNPSGDKFKFRNATLAVKLADGTWAATNADARTHCHDAQWAHFEGTPFQANGESADMELRFDGK